MANGVPFRWGSCICYPPLKTPTPLSYTHSHPLKNPAIFHILCILIAPLPFIFSFTCLGKHILFSKVSKVPIEN
ncbi:hypothetical protein RIF29_21631 [Crotalaria pallida]|uniref:Uncharacterized protein n=1 Tax=Crotalaria pallida TaxID=3830 RepID=A0AAN9F708_CROPI